MARTSSADCSRRVTEQTPASRWSATLAQLVEEVEEGLGQPIGRQGVPAARLRQAWGDGIESAVEAQLRDEKALEFLGSRAKVEVVSAT